MIVRAILEAPMVERKHLRALAGGAAEPTSAAPSDDQVVEGLLAGRPWAAEELYDRLHPAVDRALRRVLHSNGDDHDDLVQIVFRTHRAHAHTAQIRRRV